MDLKITKKITMINLSNKTFIYKEVFTSFMRWYAIKSKYPIQTRVPPLNTQRFIKSCILVSLAYFVTHTF